MKIFIKFYSFLFYLIVLSNALQLLNPNSISGIYYNTTIVFNTWYILPYFLNIFNALINCIVCVIIFAYAFDMQGLPAIPLWLFYVRIFSDCTGHSYDIKMVQSGFAQGKLFGFIGLASLILPVLPSYLIQWRLRFNHK